MHAALVQRRAKYELAYTAVQRYECTVLIGLVLLSAISAQGAQAKPVNYNYKN